MTNIRYALHATNCFCEHDNFQNWKQTVGPLGYNDDISSCNTFLSWWSLPQWSHRAEKKTSKRGKKSDKIRFAVKHLALTGHPVCDHIVEMKCWRWKLYCWLEELGVIYYILLTWGVSTCPDCRSPTINTIITTNIIIITWRVSTSASAVPVNSFSLLLRRKLVRKSMFTKTSPKVLFHFSRSGENEKNTPPTLHSYGTYVLKTPRWIFLLFSAE